MGLYLIPIRERDSAAIILRILSENGYEVSTLQEQTKTEYHVKKLGNRRPLSFSITAGGEPTFRMGVGSRSDEIVRLLSDHQIFAAPSEDGSS